MVATSAMPHPTGPVEVVLDAPRRLRYTLAAIRRIFEEKGTDYFDAVATGADPIRNLERLAYLAWQGLRHEDPVLTLEDVEEIVDLTMIVPLQEAIARALGQDVPSVPAPAGAGGRVGEAGAAAPEGPPAVPTTAPRAPRRRRGPQA